MCLPYGKVPGLMPSTNEAMRLYHPPMAPGSYTGIETGIETGVVVGSSLYSTDPFERTICSAGQVMSGPRDSCSTLGSPRAKSTVGVLGNIPIEPVANHFRSGFISTTFLVPHPLEGTYSRLSQGRD